MAIYTKIVCIALKQQNVTGTQTMLLITMTNTMALVGPGLNLCCRANVLFQRFRFMDDKDDVDDNDVDVVVADDDDHEHDHYDDMDAQDENASHTDLDDHNITDVHQKQDDDTVSIPTAITKQMKMM